MEKIYIAFLLFVPGIAFAQQAAGDSTYFQVDSVIVTAGRNELPLYKIPFSVDIINQDQLNSQHGSLTAENIFNTIPGVIVDDRNNFSEGDRISMRGIGALSQFGVDGIKIILDGIPLTFADGTSELSNLDINSIGRIEVIRGPSSFLYGRCNINRKQGFKYCGFKFNSRLQPRKFWAAKIFIQCLGQDWR
jgi:iron complex outermembrane receptor protein